MNIVSSGNQLQIIDNGVTTYTLKSAVTRVEGYLSKYLRIFVKNGYKESQWAKVKFADVTSPVAANLDALVTLVKGYLSNSLKFTATAGQTTFDCTGYFNVNDNFYVFLNGTRQSFSVARSGDIVTVANAVEGDEIIVVQP
jgi:hypothetical protein